MSSALPPPVRAYQRSVVSLASKPAHSTPLNVTSPTAFLATPQKAWPADALEQVRVEAAARSPPAAHCAVHSCPHPLARPPPVSSTCCLPRASFWNLRCSCIFSSLPDELLLFNVFSCFSVADLAALAPVCSRWRFLATDPMLHREVDLSKHAKVVDEQVFDALMGRVGDRVGTLKLCNLKLLSSESLQRLGDVHLTNNASLEALHFCSIKHVDLAVLSRVLVGSVASSLRELSLFGCVGVDDACVRLIRRSCVRLADLSLRGCLKITDAAFAEEEGEVPLLAEDELVMKSSATIDVLEEGFAQSPVEPSSPSTSSVSSLASYTSSASSSSSSAAPLGRFAHLTSLNVANCKLLTEAGLISIFRGSPLLEKLNLHGVNPTDTMLDILTSYCPRLHTLHLSSANPFGGNLQLTDAGVAYLAERLPDMQCLNLAGSSKITDAGVQALMQRCRQLEKLNLGGCFKLTHAAVQAVAQAEYDSRITHLSFFQCAHVTDEGVRLLAERLHRLQHLDVHSCANLTDAGLEQLLQRDEPQSEIPPQHQSLDEDAVVTAPPRAVLAFRLPDLLSIDVGSCRKISKDVVAKLNLVRPRVAVTHY